MSDKCSTEVDNILNILGNTTRRRILYLLSEEPRYFIQLSRDLKISQQAILKHLELLKKYGLITSYKAKSNLAAPERKYYHLDKSLYLSIGITRDNVKMEIRDISQNKTETIDDQMDFELNEEVKRLFENNDDINNLLNSSNILLKKINDKLDDIEYEKVSLLKLKQNVMKKVHDTIRSNFDDFLERTVLSTIVSSNSNINVESLSEQFDVKEKEVTMCLMALKQRLNLSFE